MEHELPDRVGRVPAIREQIGEGIEPALRDVHPERGQQVGKGLLWNVVTMDGLSQCNEYWMGRPRLVTLLQILFPPIKLLKSFVLRCVSLVCKVVCNAGKRIDAPDIRALVLWNEERRYRKIFVVGSGDSLAELKRLLYRMRVR